MKLDYKITALIILIAFSGCERQSSIAKFDLIPFVKKKVDSLKKDSNAILKIDLCDQLPFTWDTIFIMEPYTSADKLRKAGYDNSVTLENKLPELALNEGNSILLFVDKKHIQKYAIVPRSLIDFTTVTQGKVKVDEISKKDVCDRLFLKKISPEVISLQIN